MSENNNQRRDFIKKAGTVFTFGAFASSFASVINSCEQDEIVPAPAPETVDVSLSPYSELANPGGFALVKVTKKDGTKIDVIVKRIDMTTFVVLDTLCRHQGCTVTLPESANEDIICYCHNVTFDMNTGEVKVKPIADAVPALIKYKVFAYDATTNVLKIKM